MRSSAATLACAYARSASSPATLRTWLSSDSCSALAFAVLMPVAAPETTPFSRTATLRPSCLQSSAVVMPAMPPPMTATSTSRSRSSDG
jgi:hypothetical protein